MACTEHKPQPHLSSCFCMCSATVASVPMPCLSICAIKSRSNSRGGGCVLPCSQPCATCDQCMPCGSCCACVCGRLSPSCRPHSPQLRKLAVWQPLSVHACVAGCVALLPAMHNLRGACRVAAAVLSYMVTSMWCICVSVCVCMHMDADTAVRNRMALVGACMMRQGSEKRNRPGQDLHDATQLQQGQHSCSRAHTHMVGTCATQGPHTHGGHLRNPGSTHTWWAPAQPRFHTHTWWAPAQPFCSDSDPIRVRYPAAPCTSPAQGNGFHPRTSLRCARTEHMYYECARLL